MPTARIGYLWRRVCALGVAQIVSWGTLFYTIAVLGGAMRADTGVGDLWLFGSFTAGLFASGLAMRRHERLTRAQMLMAANAPILAKTAMSDGDPVHGYLPSGTVAGVIDDRPSCAALIERIVAEAEATLARLAGTH